MAGKFVLTAEVQLQSPKNLSRIASDINKALSGSADIRINTEGASRSTAELKKVEAQTKATAKAADQASGKFKSLGKALSEAVVHVARYDVARRIVVAFSQSLSNAVSDAISFERELIKVAQVTGKTAASLKGLTNEITRLSTTFGVSSKALIKTSRILSQTGLAAGEVQKALEALAKSTLAPTFDDITSTAETSIAAMAQFGIQARDLEGLLSKINSVAGNFAVEAGDIGTAIKRAGGSFKAAGGDVTELIALFTSVRSTTRETAETIATGFRTIFTRLQRPTTIKFLRQFGVELQTMEGQFVGPLEAVKRLNVALKGIDPKDVRFAQIVEQLGGFRQVSKVIPLIQEFDKTQAALNVQMNAGNSISKDAETAQSALAVQFTKTKEAFTALIREIADDGTLRGMIEIALKMAEGFLKAVNAIKPLIPLLVTLSTIKIGAGIASFAKGRGGRGRGGGIPGVFGFNKGGLVPGQGNRDTVPAMLSPGEFVVTKRGVSSVGLGALHGINKYAKGGPVKADQFTRESLTRRIVRDKINLSKPARKPFEEDQQFNANDMFSIKSFGRTVVNSGGVQQGKGKSGKKFITLNAVGDIKKRSTFREGSTGFLLAKNMQRDRTGDSFEKLLNKMGIISTPIGGNAPFDGKTVGGGFVEARNRATGTGIAEILDKSTREAFRSGFKINKELRDQADNITLPFGVDLVNAGKNLVSPSKSKKFARGGSISGTDTVPALLTPGEFVVNRRSAGAFGYNNLANINKYAGGGIVRGGKHRYAGTSTPATGGIRADIIAASRAGQKSRDAGGVDLPGLFKRSATSAKSLAEQFQAVEQQMKKNGATAKEINDARRSLLRVVERDAKAGKKSVDVQDALNKARTTATKVAKRHASGVIAQARRQDSGGRPRLTVNRGRGKKGRIGVEGGVEGGGGSALGATALFASTLSAAASTATEADTAFGKLVSAISDVVIVTSTMAFVGKEFGDDLADVLKKGIGGAGGFAIEKFGVQDTVGPTGFRTGGAIGLEPMAARVDKFKTSVGAATTRLAAAAPMILALVGATQALGGAMREAAKAAIDNAVAQNRMNPELGGSRALAGAAGAIQGAGIAGASLVGLNAIAPAIIAALGPIGIAAVAVTAAIGGLAYALGVFEEDVKKAQFADAAKSASSALGEVINSEKELAVVISRVRKDFRDMSASGQENAETTKKLTADLTKALGKDFTRQLAAINIPEDVLVSQLGEVSDSSQLLASRQKIAGKVTERFALNFGKEIRRIAADQGITTVEYIAQLKKQALAAAEAAIVQAKLTKALREQATFLNEARDVAGALKQMNESVQQSTQSILSLTSGFGQLENRFRQPAVARVSEAAKNPEDILDFKKFNDEVDANAAFLKKAGLGTEFTKSLSQGTKESARAIRDLPNVIQSVGAMPSLGKDQFATAVLDKLNIDSGGTVGQLISSKLLEILQDPAGEKRFKDDPNAVAKELAEGLPEIFAVQQEAANLQNQHNQAMAQLYGRRIELENNLLDKKKRVMDFEDEIAEKMAKREGRERTLAELTQRRFERARKTLGKQDALGAGGGAADVDLSVSGLVKRFKALRTVIDANNMTIKAGGDTTGELTRRTTELMNQSNRTARALRELGNTSKEVAAIERKSASDTKALDQKRTMLTDIVFGDDAARRQAATNLSITKRFTTNLEAATRAAGQNALINGKMTTGGRSPFDGVLQSRRGDVLQTLRKLQDVPIFQQLDKTSLELMDLSDFSKKDVRASLESRGAKFEGDEDSGFRMVKQARATGRDAERLAVAAELMSQKGLTPEQAKALVSGQTPEMEKLEGIRGLLEKQLEVMEAEAKLAEDDTKTFDKIIAAQNKSFLSELKSVLLMAEERRAKRLADEAQGKADQAGAASRIFATLSNLFTGPGFGAKKRVDPITKRVSFKFGDIEMAEEKLAESVRDNAALLSKFGEALKDKETTVGGRGLQKNIMRNINEKLLENIEKQFSDLGKSQGRSILDRTVGTAKLGPTADTILSDRKQMGSAMESFVKILGLGRTKLGTDLISGTKGGKGGLFGKGTVDPRFLSEDDKIRAGQRGGAGFLAPIELSIKQFVGINKAIIQRLEKLRSEGQIDENQYKQLSANLGMLQGRQRERFMQSRTRDPKTGLMSFGKVQIDFRAYSLLLKKIIKSERDLVTAKESEIKQIRDKLKTDPRLAALPDDVLTRLARFVGGGAGGGLRKDFAAVQGTDLLAQGAKKAADNATALAGAAQRAADALEEITGKKDKAKETSDKDKADKDSKLGKGGKPAPPKPKPFKPLKASAGSGFKDILRMAGISPVDVAVKGAGHAATEKGRSWLHKWNKRLGGGTRKEATTGQAAKGAVLKVNEVKAKKISQDGPTKHRPQTAPLPDNEVEAWNRINTGSALESRSEAALRRQRQ